MSMAQPTAGHGRRCSRRTLVRPFLGFAGSVGIFVRRPFCVHRPIRTERTLNDEKMQCLLRNRYVLCKQWSDVAEAMGYSVSTVKRLHKKILKNLES